MGMDNVFPGIQYHEDGREEKQSLYSEIKQAYTQNKTTKYSKEEYENLKNEITNVLKDKGVYIKHNIVPELYVLHEDIRDFFKKEGFLTSFTAVRTLGDRGATLEIKL